MRKTNLMIEKQETEMSKIAKVRARKSFLLLWPGKPMFAVTVDRS